MHKGDVVRVISPVAPLHLVGMTGIIEKVYLSGDHVLFGVAIADVENPRSKYGVFWFNKSQIELFEEETHMNTGFIVATINFLDGYNANTGYAYALYDKDICVGDTVVVNTGHHGMAIAKIAAINELSSSLVKYGREVVCKIDMTAFNARKEKAKRIAALEKEMKAKAAKLQTVALYEMMAEKSPELKEMLDEYKQLTGEPTA